MALFACTEQKTEGQDCAGVPPRKNSNPQYQRSVLDWYLEVGLACPLLLAGRSVPTYPGGWSGQIISAENGGTSGAIHAGASA